MCSTDFSDTWLPPSSMCSFTIFFFNLRMHPLFVFESMHFIILLHCKMSASVTIFLLLISSAASTTTSSAAEQMEMLQMVQTMVSEGRNRFRSASMALHGSEQDSGYYVSVALSDCEKLYEEGEWRLWGLISGENFSREDGRTWLTGVLANHRSCLDGLREKGISEAQAGLLNLTLLINDALAFSGRVVGKGTGGAGRPKSTKYDGILASWNPATSKAHLTVAKDGSGRYRTINEAVDALAKLGHNRPQRAIIYVKSGVYNENVEIQMKLRNVMLVGDGIGRTIVTATRNVADGSTTLNSATFGVSGDGFWARDMTFENAAGPHKHQAVALRVSSDLSVFYRCSFIGYQDTLYVHSLRQFYRDCQVYGTIDFIFGDASVVFQNCDIFVRRPMRHQANMITAQGRANPNENTGISIQNCRVSAAPDFVAVKSSFRSYLGRPWRKYSRTVFLKTDLDGLIDRKGWTEWEGDFGLSTLYYGEYMNTGVGAFTGDRVKWPGFHVLNHSREANLFSVSNFIQGELWIPVTGVPFSVGI